MLTVHPCSIRSKAVSVRREQYSRCRNPCERCREHENRPKLRPDFRLRFPMPGRPEISSMPRSPLCSISWSEASWPRKDCRSWRDEVVKLRSDGDLTFSQRKREPSPALHLAAFISRVRSGSRTTDRRKHPGRTLTQLSRLRTIASLKPPSPESQVPTDSSLEGDGFNFRFPDAPSGRSPRRDVFQ